MTSRFFRRGKAGGLWCVLPLSAAILACGGTGAAAAAALPDFPVKTYCDGVARAGGAYSSDVDNTCIDNEKNAKQALASQWNTVPADTVDYCMDVAKGDGPGSYVLLHDCIMQEIKAAPANGEPSPPQ